MMYMCIIVVVVDVLWLNYWVFVKQTNAKCVLSLLLCCELDSCYRFVLLYMCVLYVVGCTCVVVCVCGCCNSPKRKNDNDEKRKNDNDDEKRKNDNDEKRKNDNDDDWRSIRN